MQEKWSLLKYYEFYANVREKWFWMLILGSCWLSLGQITQLAFGALSFQSQADIFLLMSNTHLPSLKFYFQACIIIKIPLLIITHRPYFIINIVNKPFFAIYQSEQWGFLSLCLKNSAVRLYGFLMRNAKLYADSAGVVEKGGVQVHGWKQWIVEQPRQNLSILLWLLPHTIIDIEQQQPRCVEERGMMELIRPGWVFLVNPYIRSRSRPQILVG